MSERYTISVFSENIPGLLQRVTAIFTRRKINIESITASETEFHDLSRYTIVVCVTDEMARKLVDQIRRIVEVRQAYSNRDENLLAREVAIIRLGVTAEEKVEQISAILEGYNARIAYVNTESLLVEVVGSERDIRKLLGELKIFDITEFIQSGRIAVTLNGDEQERKRMLRLEKKSGIICITNDNE